MARMSAVAHADAGEAARRASARATERRAAFIA
jgi:hypothetical protein